MSESDSGELGIVPGDSEASEIFRRITSDDEYERMPPEDASPPLNSQEIELLRQWIESGAEYDLHWSFTPIKKPESLDVADRAWVRNPIDMFILERLSDLKLEPAAEASRERLLRRLSLDITGLPPSIDESQKFLADSSEAAYEKQVDRLLSSPQFGEHWARHWLDLARYADSQGYAQDEIRTIWPYRDWVINAINDDMPFDQFTLEQLAGDLLPNPTTSQLVATGFHRNTMTNTEGGTDDEEYRHAAIVDRANTTAQVWMGLTMGCAQCHTHKFDPITHHDYYRFFAIFNQTTDSDKPDNRPTIPFLTESQQKELKALNEQFRSMLSLDADKPNELERVAKELDAIKNRIAAVKTFRTPVMQENPSDKLRKSFVAIRGAYANPGDEVEASTPSFLNDSLTEPDSDSTSRLKLANWLTSPHHPMTARVEANRIWEQIMGVGIVETSEDFGSQGALPSHPELLDWMASSLVDNGWSRKKMIKMIVMSATYRQSSEATTEKLAIDPFNRFYSSAARYRLSAEQIRDYALSVSGMLSAKMHGPPVRPPQPKSGMSAAFGGSLDWEASHGEDRYRRAIYTLWRRTSPYPSFMALDAIDRRVCTTRRIRTNTPVAAFVTMNDPAFVEAAVATGKRILKVEPGKRIEFAFRLIVCRVPDEKESKVVARLLAQQLEHYQKDVAAAKELMKFYEPASKTAEDQVAELAAWTMVANTLLNLDEVLTRN